MLASENKYISKINDFGEVLERQHSFYGSDSIKKIIEKGGEYTSETTGLTYRIPTHFGFCYGVEKSIDLAFQTVKRFPNRRIFLTHDVIHNPKVNQDLEAKNVTVLDRDDNNELILDHLTNKDIVVISAFGSKFKDVESLKAKNCVVVDTTCGAIVMVWKRVEKYAKSGYTAVIHGIWDHEETQATASQAAKFNGHFIIIRNMEQAAILVDFMKKKISSDEFMKFFTNNVSEGFDPNSHLQKIGIASQTTMLKSETLGIQEFLKNSCEEIYGGEALKNHFMKYDTICSATQERQDALFGLLEQQHDLIIIIGGFNSSNTTHLSEIAGLKFPTFHIEGPDHIVSRDEIRHLDPLTLKVKTTRDWLPKNLKSIGISTGASTPDISIEKTIAEIEKCFSQA